MKLTELKSSETQSFRRGYYCAVATLVALHGTSIQAEETLAAYGPVNFAGIDDYDVAELEPLAREIKRKAAASDSEV